ncbi:MAG: TIGR04283 family arsenosugar biosynthesis glycosyltransferase, partial [Gemmatimonadota bacterium]|nr:TIGR04283 family arsenosugar biosynthesis glycosyltransferase [Gemmatimonadota bacterium]
LPSLLDALEGSRPGLSEIVVADAGSEDATVEIARSRGCRTLVAPRGRASQLNAGAAATDAGVLWFLHADTVPPPDATREILDAVEAGAPGGAFRVAFPPEERAAHPLLPVIERGIDVRTRATRTATGDQGIFARRSAFDAVGGFPDWPLFEDVAFFSALREVGRPAICPGPLRTSARRWIDEGPARTMARMWALRLGYWAGVSPRRLAGWWRDRPAG